MLRCGAKDSCAGMRSGRLGGPLKSPQSFLFVITSQNFTTCQDDHDDEHLLRRAHSHYQAPYLNHSSHLNRHVRPSPNSAPRTPHLTNTHAACISCSSPTHRTRPSASTRSRRSSTAKSARARIRPGSRPTTSTRGTGSRSRSAMDCF